MEAKRTRLTTNWNCPTCGQIISSRQTHDESHCASFAAGMQEGIRIGREEVVDYLDQWAKANGYVQLAEDQSLPIVLHDEYTAYEVGFNDGVQHVYNQGFRRVQQCVNCNHCKLAEVAEDAKLLEVGRKAIEDALVDRRDNRVSEFLRGNGLVCCEADGKPSNIIRFGPETALRIGLKAIAEHVQLQSDKS